MSETEKQEVPEPRETDTLQDGTPDPVIEVPAVTQEEPSPQEAPPVIDTMPPPPPRRSGGFGRFLGLVAGGALAAGMGFALATYGVQQGWPLMDQFMPRNTTETDALRAEIDKLGHALAALEANPAAAIDLAPVEQRLTALEERPAASADLSAVEGRIAALESRVAAQQPGDSTAIAAEIEAQVAARMQDVKREADAMQAEAEALRDTAARDAALIGLRSAVQTGIGLPAALAEVEAQEITLPDPLPAFVAAPVSLASLQDSFPEAARAALAAARMAAQADGTVTDRLAVFLLNQTGARATEPQEGDSPDAVLSRAEAALASGDVAAARQGIASLPEAAQPALGEWAAEADRFLAAQAALAALIPGQ